MSTAERRWIEVVYWAQVNGGRWIADMRNTPHYGDNLEILRNRDFFPYDCVDLIYLDPPFNSNRDYNALFKAESGAYNSIKRAQPHKPSGVGADGESQQGLL